jgi:cytochrome c oxidase subunit 1
MGAVFAIFAATNHWFPLMTGLTLHQRWAKAQFFLMFIGVNLTFFPQHFLGLSGIPRRYSDYPDTIMQWNVVSSIGSIIAFVALLIFIFIIWEALAVQRPVISTSHMPSSMEWRDMHPLRFHNLDETTVITYPYKEASVEEQYAKIKQNILLNK